MARFLGEYFIEDGDLIQASTRTAVPLDVPVFVVVGSNDRAILFLQAYKKSLREKGCTPPELDHIDEVIKRFTAYRTQHQVV